MSLSPVTAERPAVLDPDCDYCGQDHPSGTPCVPCWDDHDSLGVRPGA